MMPLNLLNPVINGVKHITYHREPTLAEIKFGEGATHYLNIPANDVIKTTRNGRPVYKKWTVADRLRYYL